MALSFLGILKTPTSASLSLTCLESYCRPPLCILDGTQLKVEARGPLIYSTSSNSFRTDSNSPEYDLVKLKAKFGRLSSRLSSKRKDRIET
jgi:hypothetical protein